MTKQKIKAKDVLVEIRNDVRFLRDEITVNGSKGMENILKDHESHFKRLDERIILINDCTQHLQSKRKLQKVMAEYFFDRPRLAVAYSFITSWKCFVLILLILLLVFGIIEPKVLYKLIPLIGG
jgi:hypothetical protein